LIELAVEQIPIPGLVPMAPGDVASKIWWVQVGMATFIALQLINFLAAILKLRSGSNSDPHRSLDHSFLARESARCSELTRWFVLVSVIE